jgi:hypothetical protein
VTAKTVLGEGLRVTGRKGLCNRLSAGKKGTPPILFGTIIEMWPERGFAGEGLMPRHATSKDSRKILQVISS